MRLGPMPRQNGIEWERSLSPEGRKAIPRRSLKPQTILWLATSRLQAEEKDAFLSI